MKTVLTILALSILGTSAQAADLRCSVIAGSAEPQVIEFPIAVSVDVNNPDTFVRSYEVAQTAVGTLSASIDGLNKEIVLSFRGNRKDDLSVAANGSFKRTGLVVRSSNEDSKNISVSCFVM
jgi:hypothetical protein